jgi:lipopolysaccharide export system protein LptA
MIKYLHVIFFCLCLLCSTTRGYSQTDADTTVRKIEFINADYSEYNKSLGIDAMRIIGKVVMKHEGTYMFADSAYRYMERNAFDAFSNIHIEQGDSLDIYGDTLKYDGSTRMATIIGRVRMIDKEVVMNTDKVLYDLKNKTAYYPDSAVTRSGNNLLRSKTGYYFSDRKELAFKQNVVIENPNYTVYSDTLHFKTVTEVAYFYGPTRIYSKENFIYCENGWYDTRQDIASFNRNAYLQTKSQTLRGDSLYYERKNGFGKAIRNVTLTDTVEKVVVKGHYSESFEKKEKYLVTDSMTLIMAMENDSLFLSADTLLVLKNFADTACGKYVHAFHRVRFYKKDFQGACDSLCYITGDSLLQMYSGPILWNEENQITSVFIDIYLNKGKIKQMNMLDKAFIVSKEDTVRFNQISGAFMQGFFVKNELRKVDVFSGGQTIYYPKEEKGDLIGANKAESTDLSIYMEEKKVSRIVFRKKPIGTLSPLEKIDDKNLRLEGFSWQIERRPKSVSEIYSPKIVRIIKEIQENPKENIKKPSEKSKSSVKPKK